jgi:hypothetical protein
MFEHGRCPSSNHVAPRGGGSCPCGMVTRIPPRKKPAPAPSPQLLALLAQCLDDGPGGLEAAAAGLLSERADRLLAALTSSGLLDPGAVGRLAAA